LRGKNRLFCAARMSGVFRLRRCATPSGNLPMPAPMLPAARPATLSSIMRAASTMRTLRRGAPWPQDKEHGHMAALANRLVAQDRWLLLVDAALANRALDPVLPRLLQRDPERLLDRMTLLLTEPRGPEMVPAMARLLRTIGVPVLNLLETRLYEARRQRVT